MIDGGILPCVASRINSRERHATIEDLEVRLVLQVQRTSGRGRNGLGKTDNCIMVDDSALLNGSARDSRGGNGQAGNESSDENHFEDARVRLLRE